MMSTSIDISTSIKGSPLVDLFIELDRVAKDEEISYFVVGATARDLVLEHGFGVNPPSATRDVDIGIHATSWEEFERLKTALVASGKFATVRPSQRLRFHKDQLPIDILPFGPISDQSELIRWPNEDGVEMNVQGFNQAYTSSITVVLQHDPALEIKVASPGGLVLLKLIAWKDRRVEKPEEVDDLSVIVNNYLKMEGIERITDEHPDLIDEDFDYVRAGARLLGRDLAKMVEADLCRILIEILDEILDTDAGYQFVYRFAGPVGDEEESASVIAAIRRELKQSLG